MSTDPTHTTLSIACWNSDHHPDRCAESLADGDVCDCRCHTSNPATAAPSGPATFQECIAAWPQATDCTDNPEWGTHMCDEVVDHAGDHVCTCGQHVPQCRAEYAPERRDPTARIVHCSLARGHNGDHTELFTEATWPQTAATVAPATPGQADIDQIETRAHLYNLLTHQIGSYTPELAKAAEASADDVPGLLAELRRLSGQLVERTDRLMETLHKRDELAERLELAEEASDRLRAELVEVTTERDHLRQYAETVRHHQQSSSEGWREVERLRGELERANGAAPGVWQLPAEPPEHVTELWTASGIHANRCGQHHGCWVLIPGSPLSHYSFMEMLTYDSPLSTTPPARTRHPISPELANMGVRFWVCPVPAHVDRRGPTGRPVVTVEWLDGVAHCTADGCEHNSAETTPPTGTEAQ